MRWSYKLGTIFGFPIRVHVSLLIFMGFILMSGSGLFGLILMIAVFASVVLHELGHAVVARRFGLPIIDISLYPFGGMARMGAPPKTTRDEILMAAAGPAVSLAIALVFAVFGYLTGEYTILLLAEINLMLGLFNLVPALPMDGGRIFRAYLAKKRGFFKATTIAARLARWIAAMMAIAGVLYSGWLLILAAFLLFTSMAEEGAARARYFMGDPGYQDAPRSGRVFRYCGAACPRTRRR